MIRVQNVCEKDIVAVPANAAVAVGAASVNILPDATRDREEIAHRFIQNVGSNPVLWALGQECDGVNYHGSIAAGATLEVPISKSAERVACYSATGSTVVTCVLRRVDLYQHANIVPS